MSSPRKVLCLIRSAPSAGTPFIPSPPLITERHDGLFQIGFGDETAAGPFESRHFAEAVRLQRTRHLPQWARA